MFSIDTIDPSFAFFNRLWPSGSFQFLLDEKAGKYMFWPILFLSMTFISTSIFCLGSPPPTRLISMEIWVFKLCPLRVDSESAHLLQVWESGCGAHLVGCGSSHGDGGQWWVPGRCLKQETQNQIRMVVGGTFHWGWTKHIDLNLSLEQCILETIYNHVLLHRDSHFMD